MSMTQTIKRLSTLSLMVVLLCGTQGTVEAKKRGWDWGTFLVGAGCAAVAGAVGCAVYNACQSPSDSEELSAGQRLVSDARDLQAKCASRYQNDCAVHTSVNQLKHSILHHSSHRLPYTSYISKLKSDIARAHSMTSDLISKKNHLFERKMELPSNSDLSHEERIVYTEHYDAVIDQLAKQIDILQAMCNDLRSLEITIVAFPEYREEQLVEQLNKLEDKLESMNHHVSMWSAQPVVPCYWYEPVISYEPTIVLHGDITPVGTTIAQQPTSNWGVGFAYTYSE
jgi:hypothetical protein